MLDMKHDKAMLLISGKTPPEILRERITEEGKVVMDPETGTLMLNASNFINHQVDCHLMAMCGQHLAYRSRGRFGTTKILATRMGALLAQGCALHMGLPLILALEQRPVGAEGVHVFEAGGLFISSEFLSSDDRVLVMDLFLSTGTTAAALTQMAEQAGASVVGYGFMIEKAFEGGRAKLQAEVPVESLVAIKCVSEGNIQFQDELSSRFSSPPMRHPPPSSS